ncbi:MAG: putative toxin-antitoxin system toxin component, PIN family [Muribaculaceae bacterium]|nr:putative toxin-antitoxin system toxin component, PIN family [Muribaculaceae bacterium]
MKDVSKIYAVVDTNVIVSALLSSNKHSNPNIIINAINMGVLIPIYNEEIEAEYKEVLSRPRFKLSEEQVSIFISVLRKFGIRTEPTKVVDEVFPDPDDVVFYEVKMSIDDSYLITGNLKHFPKKSFVVTPAEMVKILFEYNLITLPF